MIDGRASADVDGLWDAVQPPSSRRILLAALEAFSTQGYHASTTRSIAQAAGMSPAALYVHYGSKAELLYEMSRTGHAAVLQEVSDAGDGRDGPADRLGAMVAALVAWHIRNHALARVIHYELEEMTPERLDQLDGLQRSLEDVIGAEVRRGVEAGVFSVDDVTITTQALLSLGADIARWWPRPGTDPAGLPAAYAALALRLVRVAP